MRCPTCNNPNASGLKSVIKNNRIISGCQNCQNNIVRHSELSAQHRRNYQSREYARDLVQPFEPDYVKARGIEAAREKGWTDEQIRKFG